MVLTGAATHLPSGTHTPETQQTRREGVMCVLFLLQTWLQNKTAGTRQNELPGWWRQAANLGIICFHAATGCCWDCAGNSSLEHLPQMQSLGFSHFTARSALVKLRCVFPGSFYHLEGGQSSVSLWKHYRYVTPGNGLKLKPRPRFRALRVTLGVKDHRLFKSKLLKRQMIHSHN